MCLAGEGEDCRIAVRNSSPSFSNEIAQLRYRDAFRALAPDRFKRFWKD